MIPLFIPSPSNGVWHLGPVPIRGYALAIILGIVASIWIGERRWAARGGRAGEIQDLAVWAVPFGLVGGRLYHVATDHERYFGADGNPWQILYVWKGGLGIWGSIFLGAVGAMIAAHRRGMRIAPMVDILAPGLLVAQALGRWGNWFNQELFGKPTDLPWALEIDPQHRPPGYEDQTTFHPTFLYECLWDLGVFGVLLALDRRFRIGHGRMLALYVMGYTLGRGWIEMLRIDTVELSDVGGLRFNVWTSIVLFVVAAIYFVVSLRLWPGREESVYVEGHDGRGDEPPTGEPVDVTPPRPDGETVEGRAVHDPETRAGPGPSA
ncbi:prolipoprotein diacylglyceryl transferase [Nocardioides anomalus]|uniref:Phosphatidylglycerol--prolipoprotein diacylglyceryl transferase n=1 Tax=Nocardioides anomalus TaxID=2712223 RepID=A0A6G6WBP1_9ACTN|nr:prolipoprotein diacylglyceryl transferase [Nocardioides anomalus]QIG42626.1 prolipoprotein diacylglyceryl transferase [Nocardioides anomalus]